MRRQRRAGALRGAGFFRMVDVCLAGSEAAFRAGDMMVFQMQLTRAQTAVPQMRHAMGKAERAFAARDTVRRRRRVRRG